MGILDGPSAVRKRVDDAMGGVSRWSPANDAEVELTSCPVASAARSARYGIRW
jgi:hypothetical protein